MSPLCQCSAIFGDDPLDAKCVYTSVSASTHGCVVFVDLRSDLNANSASLWPEECMHFASRGFRLQNGATLTQRRRYGA